MIHSHYQEKPDPKNPVSPLKDIEKSVRDRLAMENAESELRQICLCLT